jgi:hypothetical protein
MKTKRKKGALLAAIPLIVAIRANAQAETNLATHLVVRSEGDCPSAQAVAQALWAIRPDHAWPPLTATVQVVGDQVQVSLGEERNHWREVPAPPDCTDRASRAAVVIAVWSGALFADVTESPSLSVAVPAPISVPAPLPARKSAMVTEVGISGFSSTVGGWVPGGRVELGRLRREGWWGIRATAGYQSTKSLRLDIGESHYDRSLLGAALAMQWQRSYLLLSSDWGLVGSYLRASGNGYSQNQSASGLNVGLAADGRVGLRLRAFRIWATVSLYRWARRETVQVDPLNAGASSTFTLPAWDAHLGLGVGVVFD